MSRFAPTWLFSAQAIEAAGDPHLQPGVHLRALLGGRLGLPLAPLVVSRMVLGQSVRVGERVRVVWTDSSGQRLFPPIRLGETGPVTAWLPAAANDPVISAVVEMEAEDKEARVDAVLSGLLGPTVLASATRSPWLVCGTGMDRLVVSGEGRIEGIRVTRAGMVRPRKVKQWQLLALPVEEGVRYRGIADAWAAAEERVLRGAPHLVGLHDDPGASDPGSCSPVEPAEEIDRVGFLWQERLEPVVDLLLNDVSAPQQSLRMPPEALVGTRTEASFEVPALASLLQAVLDPGVGRLVGLAEHDKDPPREEGYVVLYLIRGAFSLQREVLGRRRLAWLGGGAPDDPAEFPLDLPPSTKDPRQGSFADLWTVAGVAIGTESPRPQPPAVVGIEDLGWVPDSSPEDRRHIAIGLSGLGPAAAVALARESPGFAGLNPRLPDLFGSGPDRAVPIVCGILAETGLAPAASGPGQGEVCDRSTPAEGADYRIAQSDWFGRWSDWTFGSASEGARPAVPIPVLEAEFVSPTAAGESGTLEVRCVQPRDDDLPPGGLPLEWLELSAQVDGGGGIGTTVPADRGAAPPGADPVPIVGSIPVPPLLPAEKRWLIVSGAWIDAGGRRSAESPPTRAQAADPRAPAALTLPNALAYGSRPDALGRSRVRLEWAGAPPPTRYRVYHSDETTLRERLAGLPGPEADAARAQLAGVDAAPDRAAVFRAHAGLFDRSCFELLTGSPLPSSGVRMSYEHELSGSLGVLAFYRVVPVSELGAEATFTACTLLPRGVPNTQPPPTPLLTATADATDPLRVQLTISVPEGVTKPVMVRLRRSRVSGADPLGMPVVASTAPAAWPAVIADSGATPWDASLRFAPWSTYTWRAEVQGSPEPGSALPGAWSRPSAPASVRVLPPPPGAVAPGTVASTAAGVEVRFQASEPLDGGPYGAYTIDVYRQVPSGSATESGAVGTFPAAAIREPDGTYLVRDAAPVPPGTAYLVELQDPLGRRGSRVEVGTL